MSTVTSDPNTITIISLVIAILAVIVGPFISLYISKKQTESTLRMAKQNLLGPMRQAWINDLRELIIEITTNCLHYWASGTYEDLENDEYKRISHIQQKIELMINPSEEDHVNLLKEINAMVLTAGSSSLEDDDLFHKAHKTVVETTQKVLKKEWDVVKKT